MSKLSVNTIQGASNTSIAIKTHSGTDAMSIDTTGRILTPARPAFRAYLSGNLDNDTNWTYSTNPKVLTFDIESYDIGGNYDTGNGKFIVPINGIYHFDVNIYASEIEAATWISTWLFVDGAQASRTITDPQGGRYGAPWLSDNLQLTAGQEVEVRLGVHDDNSITVHGDSNGSVTHFSGYLIG